MPTVPPVLRFILAICFLLSMSFFGSCHKQKPAQTAFYYWKQNYQLNTDQAKFLANTNSKKLYIRFFDIKWDVKTQKPYPEAIIKFSDRNNNEQVTPVIFITNETFSKLDESGVDSLAIKCELLLEALTAKQGVYYNAVQVDCDWTIGTKDKYFRFLRSFRNLTKKPLEATIRLHQIKYQFKTGVPPVNRGVLMFYNMGKISADLNEPNSIYNAKTAKKYLNGLNNYLLPLDIALPVFSWTIHIRSAKVIQVYGKIGRADLINKENFIPTASRAIYKARRNFFTNGIYIQKGDLFKLEETDKILLKHAAVQLASHLNKNEKRTIIYYELGNLDLSTFKAKDFKEISAYF